MKTLKVIILVCIAIITIILLGFNFFLTESCDKLNPTYFEWFPYHQGDQLIFKSNNNSYKTITVNRFEINHTKSYSALYKCGACEDGIEIAFYGDKDSLVMGIQNLENPKSYFGFDEYVLNSADKENYYRVKDTLIDGKKYEFYKTKNHIIIKQFGMVEIRENDEAFKIVKIIRKNKKRNINEKSSCGC
ncbi:hypothetical protein [Flavobacterium eburneipallidum]|uniref:hypothetical protein n=1 Tax=Flavobacterium eburneipallidum TaxID=3003263 RepID=UPI0024826ABD|nr:hypothetical protein [Flavobacterium eburneipallidum]